MTSTIKVWYFIKSKSGNCCVMEYNQKMPKKINKNLINLIKGKCIKVKNINLDVDYVDSFDKEIINKQHYVNLFRTDTIKKYKSLGKLIEKHFTDLL